MNKAVILIFVLAWNCFSATGTATANLKIRSQASTTSDPIGGISEGQKFEIAGEENGFYRIETTTGTGYVSAKYVTVGESKAGSRSAREMDYKDWLVLAYLLFGLIVGEMMVRPVLMGWYSSQMWFTRGTGPIDILFKQIGMRLTFEAFIAAIAICLGCTLWWAYFIYRFVKGQSNIAVERA